MENEPAKNSTTLLIADAAFPMDAPPILGDAAVAMVGDRIAAVGSYADIRRQFPDAVEHSFPGHALLPGFVNAHTHLELSYMRGRIAPGTPFTQWVENLIAAYPPPEELAAVTAESVRIGLAESIRFGVTTLGDISKQVSHSRPILRDANARVVSFGEIQALGKRRHLLDERLNAAADTSLSNDRLAIGLSPHAPYTVEGATLRKIVDHALQHRLPICMHLAELAEEKTFLTDLSGPLGYDWDIMLRMDILDAAIQQHPDGPIVWAEQYGLLGAVREIPVLLAHVNYADDSDLERLSRDGVSIAYCPRTHACFGHPPHRYRDMLARGINVCLGTDSLASTPDLHLLREAQLLFRRDRTDSHTLLKMLTLNGARALGMQSSIGSLTPGKFADIIALPIASHSSPQHVADDLVDAAATPGHVWFAGHAV